MAMKYLKKQFQMKEGNIMKECGLLVYKCRRCGELSRNVHVPNCLTALISLAHGYDIPWSGAIPNIIELHSCKDGNMGISDLIGSECDTK